VRLRGLAPCRPKLSASRSHPPVSKQLGNGRRDFGPKATCGSRPHVLGRGDGAEAPRASRPIHGHRIVGPRGCRWADVRSAAVGNPLHSPGPAAAPARQDDLLAWRASEFSGRPAPARGACDAERLGDVGGARISCAFISRTWPPIEAGTILVTNPALDAAAYSDRTPQRPGVDQNRNGGLRHAY
jgi:hypothetical protein